MILKMKDYVNVIAGPMRNSHFLSLSFAETNMSCVNLKVQNPFPYFVECSLLHLLYSLIPEISNFLTDDHKAIAHDALFTPF
jgi:hypothetical protein